MLKVGSFPAILLSVPEFQNVLAKVYNKQFYPIQVDMGHRKLQSFLYPYFGCQRNLGMKLFFKEKNSLHVSSSHLWTEQPNIKLCKMAKFLRFLMQPLCYFCAKSVQHFVTWKHEDVLVAMSVLCCLLFRNGTDLQPTFC